MSRIRTAAAAAAILFGLTGGSVTLGAQTPQPTTPSPDTAVRKQVERGVKHRRQRPLFRGIELSEAQRAQIRTIHEKHRPRFVEMRRTVREQRQQGDRAASPDSATRSQIHLLRQQQRAEIRAVLTPEQQQIFDRNAAEIQERMKARGDRGRGRGERRPAGGDKPVG